MDPAGFDALDALDALGRGAPKQANPNHDFWEEIQPLQPVSYSKLDMPDELRQQFRALEEKHDILRMEHADVLYTYESRFKQIMDRLKNNPDGPVVTEGHDIEQMEKDMRELKDKINDVFLEHFRLWMVPPLELEM
ncbi:unnamed protein product [Peniophora sp. CBMAI 1063]|nr:unnamed protein product [Peniophora sp. CBMAI 1063]